MIERYHAPHAATTFHDDTRIARWGHHTKVFARAAIIADKPNKDGDLINLVDDLHIPDAKAVRTRETYTGHDVVAFLSLVEEQADPKIRKYLHYGLTSSDLVENAHHDALREHAQHMEAVLNSLNIALTPLVTNLHAPRAGRTHGQLADVTSFEWQMLVHRDIVQRLMRGLNYWPGRTHQRGLFKTPGPTGTSPFRRLRVRDGSAASTQIIPRDYQIEWASIYLRVAVEMEALATLIRCGARSEIGELAEGGVRVGSSAMPHKRNPVQSEKVCGLARMARGYFMSIAENGAFWDDRDISNSSVERIAVPDLAATVEHMVFTMTGVIQNLEINGERMHDNARDPRTASNILQTLAQKHFDLGPIEASEFVKRHVWFDLEDGTFDLMPASMSDFDGAENPVFRSWIEEALQVWLKQSSHHNT